MTAQKQVRPGGASSPENGEALNTAATVQGPRDHENQHADSGTKPRRCKAPAKDSRTVVVERERAARHQGEAEDGRTYHPKSTAGAAQRARILAALRVRPRTSYELRRLGAYQAPARIIELRRAGFNIETTRVTLVDADGYVHPNAALYSLLSEPKAGRNGGAE